MLNTVFNIFSRINIISHHQNKSVLYVWLNNRQRMSCAKLLFLRYILNFYIFVSFFDVFFYRVFFVTNNNDYFINNIAQIVQIMLEQCLVCNLEKRIWPS